MRFTKGDRVRVWPEGIVDNLSTGTVLTISHTQRSIAIGFKDKPTFYEAATWEIDGKHGFVLLAIREIVDGFEEPWRHLFKDEYFEIVHDQTTASANSE